MKKVTRKLICAALCALLCLPCAIVSNAGANGSIAGPKVEMRRTDVTVDGAITAGEYAGSFPIEEDTFGYCGTVNQMLTGKGTAYFAYDDDGVYFACDFTDLHDAYSIFILNSAGARDHVRIYADSNAGTYTAAEGGYPAVTPDGIVIDHYVAPGDVKVLPADGRSGAAYWRSMSGFIGGENEFVPCTGVASGIVFDEESYWDGDVFGFSIDPVGSLKEAGAGARSAPQYCVAVDSDGEARVASVVYDAEREVISAGEITDSVTAAGKLTRDRFVFELMVPWSMIIDDTELAAAAFGLSDFSLSASDLCADGATHKASVTFYDRFIDTSTDECESLGCYITTLPESYYSNGLRINDMGITVTNAGDPLPGISDLFDDVPEGWYSDAVLYCRLAGLMKGTSERTFSPDGILMRAQFVQILASIDGADLDSKSYSGVFEDVPAGKWYTAAVEWAAKNGYAAGVGNGEFAPEAAVTREEIAVFLRSYAYKKGYDVSGSADISSFLDASDVSDWASGAVKWAYASKIMTGIEADVFAPKWIVTRAQAAVVVAGFHAGVVAI